MRIAVTGRFGQVARSLIASGPNADVEVVTLARPAFDLINPRGLVGALAALRPQAVVSAAAYTAVDLAESQPELANRINADGAATLSQSTAQLGIPIVHLSTDYVFDGTLDRPYRECDLPRPINEYGASKLRGEQLVAAANPDHAIIRTAWVYSPFGKNFAKTMLSLASNRDEISVVSDQYGSPSNASDIANGIFKIVSNLLINPNDATLRGVFHMTGGGETNWSDFAAAIFAASAARGGPISKVKPITTAAYATAARRPANSRLDNSKLARAHGVRLPLWQDSVAETVSQILGHNHRKI